jgi:hypothetical protein
MRKWEIVIHVEDEELARNMMEELNQDGFGVTLYKYEERQTNQRVLQYCLLAHESKVGKP